MTLNIICWTIVFVCIVQEPGVSSQECEDDRITTNESLCNVRRRKCEISGTSVNCTDMSFKKIPHSLPLNVTTLDLSRNLIKEINTNLTIYTQLQKLYLQNNLIEHFQKDCFKGLDRLIYLDLQRNRLVMNNVTFPDGVFKDLISLKELKLNKNNPKVYDSGLSYPDKALADLQNLTTLQVDGLSDIRFGEGFQNMTSLSNLIIIGGREGYCQIDKLHNDTFTYLAQLYMLQIRYCLFNGSLIDNSIFMPLKSLRILDLSNDEFILFRSLAPVLKNMKSENLTHLIIHNIMSPYNPCAIVTNDFAKSLPRSLTHIFASSNGLAMIEPEVFGLLPPNLTYLDLFDNRFTFGYYLKNFSAMLNLETLILNGTIGSYNLPKWYPPKEDSFFVGNNQLLSDPSWEFVILKLPPKLKTVSMDTAGLTYDLSEFHIHPNNTLETLILDNNKIQSLIGPITGLTTLKSLSLVDCHLNRIDHTFFDNFTSLEFLNLSTNSFGRSVLRRGAYPIFRNLRNLKVLDLSFIGILTIYWNVFEGLDSLQTLYLQSNGMYNFTVNVSHTKNLQFVNFSLNDLSSLLPSVTSDFVSIADSHKLEIDFSENPIHCYCSNLDFIKWLTHSQNAITFVNQERYKCVYEDSSGEYFNEFVSLSHNLERQCIAEVTLLCTVTAATILIVCVIAVSIVYKFRWKLKYLYYSAYLYLKTKKSNHDHSNLFEFDVFVSFANEDVDFVHKILVQELKFRGLNVLIHTVDFIAGQYITSNIVNAVQSSRKTLIVVSRHLLKSTWCRFELQMANMESVHTGRSVMVFLLMEQLPKEDMDRELLYHIQNNTYMQLPEDLDDASAMGLFWTKLCSDLVE